MKRDTILKIMKAMIPFWNIIIFSYVWVLYYNEQTFSSFWIGGMLISLMLYSLIYISFGNLYHAFKIGTYQISELILSQTLAIGLADLCMYLECCLIHRSFASIMPGIAAFLVQLSGTLVLLIINKRYFSNYISAHKTLLIHGVSREDSEEDNVQISADNFRRKIQSRHSNLFNITDMCPDNIDKKELQNKIEINDTVLLYHVSHKVRSKVLAQCAKLGKEVYITPRLEDILLSNYEYRHMTDTPLLKSANSRSEYASKRVLDITISLIMLIIFSPFMIITAISIKLEDHGPVFYKQKRMTKDGKTFEILKFRSMIVDAESKGYKPCATGDSRITKTGHIIRATRIDELPQLINILKGDMSIVGPRPERVEHVEKYTKELPEFSYRLRVRGGLTGYAQIYGKYNTSAEDKLKMDLMYIEKQSLMLDLQLILLTVKVMFLPESTEGFGTEINVPDNRIKREKNLF